MSSGEYEADERARRCFRPFVPTPPLLEGVMDVLDAATDAVRTFDRRVAEWPDRGLVGKLFARLDAVHSSGAEGSTTTLTDLMEYETSLGTAPDPEDAASVAACAEAIQEVVGDDLLATVRRLHYRLFERHRDLMKASGAGRWKENVNGTADDDVPGGYFYYTRPTSLRTCLTEWRAFTLASDPAVPELVRQSLSHWMFEHIHPVADGNGRIGRLLVPIVLRDKGFTASACAFLGEAAHEDKDLYVDAFKVARRSANWTPWTRLMLGFIARTATANIARLDRLDAIKANWKSAMVGTRSDSLVHKLVPYALTRPVFTVNDARADIGGTFASVNDAAARMVEAGILVVAQGRRRDRLFQAEAVLDCFDRFRARRPEPEPEDADVFTP